MKLNADFERTAFVAYATAEWQASPAPGVDRRMLDRIGDEVARATSIVRYAPGSAFAAHTHDLGEEFYVLEGVFQDEHGDYPQGSYVRNPPTSRHTPRSDAGCTIFVKLRQFEPDDRRTVCLRPDDIVFAEVAPGIGEAVLFDDAHEQVRLLRLAPGARTEIGAAGISELLLVEGRLRAGAHAMGARDWLRLPAAASVTVQADPDAGALVWIKRRV
ncbi:MAG: cupin domain-containing protein [Nevskiales bacterium]|nr:cupin domain-containing protein [Nevskiales bacterium]